MSDLEGSGDSVAALRSLGVVEMNANRFDAALVFFRRALKQEAETGLAMLAAVCLVHTEGLAAAVNSLVECGLVPAEWRSASFTDREFLDRIHPRHAVPLFLIFDALRRNPEAAHIGVRAWRDGTVQEQRYLYHRLPIVLLKCGRQAEAGEIFLQSLDLGFPAVDFRPKFPAHPLSHFAPAAAATMLAADSARYEETLLAREAGPAAMWQPRGMHGAPVILRGVSRDDDATGFFELTPGGPGAEALRITAHRTGTGGGYAYWTAACADARPGMTYLCRLAVPGGDSSSVEFQVPAPSPARAAVSAGDAVGMTGAVLCGTVAATAPGAQYRVEYGAQATALEHSTPWRPVPPPRLARARDLLYRQSGHWQPMSTSFSLKPIHAEHGIPGGEGRLCLRFGAPFARDRNQLNGIGSHEMPLGFNWARGSAGHGLSVGAGQMDLRDAQLTFTVRGAALTQRGAALHFWIGRDAEDAAGPFTSQWALTAAPFPDQALEDGHWHDVTFALPDDPRAWTYTGNNPAEQGPRAARYRRLPLHDTLSGNNHTFVLIFAFGSPRTPPLGSLDLYAVSARYRDHSLLSAAAGSQLVESPQSGVCDPSHVTDGIRGEDAALWTSGEAPAYPLSFRWRLSRPARITHFQINQHPYWPARQAEVWGTDDAGVPALLWSGPLPDGRASSHDPPHCRVETPNAPKRCVAVELRLLSGYGDSRCGVEGFELYGEGAVFTGDGDSCTVSEEVAGLTPGTTLFYRVVIDDAGRRTESGIAAVSLPADSQPVLESATPLERGAGSPACVAIRGNAMGLETALWAEWISADGAVAKGEPVSLGCQPTARHIYCVPPAPRGAAGRLWIHARNAAGETRRHVPGWGA